MFPWLRNQNHGSQCRVHASHDHEFQCIIQHGRVGSFRGNHRQYLGQILVTETAGLQGFLPCQHLIRIASDGVDLAVVYHQTVGMRPEPAGIGVGRESGMYHGDGGFIGFILQIQEEGPKLSYQKHSFIDNGSTGKGGHIGIFVALFKHAAHHIKLAVKFKIFTAFRGTFDKCLINLRTALQRSLSQNGRYYRKFSPAEKGKTFFGHDDLKHLSRLTSLQFILRKEKHTHRIFPLTSNSDTGIFQHLLEKFMGNLRQNSNTVSGLSLSVFSRTMLQIFHDFQSIIHNCVTLLPTDIYNGSNTAVVVFERRFI